MGVVLAYHIYIEAKSWDYIEKTDAFLRYTLNTTYFISKEKLFFTKFSNEYFDTSQNYL